MGILIGGHGSGHGHGVYDRVMRSRSCQYYSVAPSALVDSSSELIRLPSSAMPRQTTKPSAPRQQKGEGISNRVSTSHPTHRRQDSSHPEGVRSSTERSTRQTTKPYYPTKTRQEYRRKHPNARVILELEEKSLQLPSSKWGKEHLIAEQRGFSIRRRGLFLSTSALSE